MSRRGLSARERERRKLQAAGARFPRVPIVGGKQPLVLVAMPMYKYPNPKTVVLMDVTLQHLGHHYPLIQVAKQTPTSTGIGAARTKVTAAVFENEEVTHLLMVDDDMRWPLGDPSEKDPFNPIARLLALDKDCVGGLGFTRHQPLRPFIGQHQESDGWGRVMNDVPDENLMRAGEPFQVDYIGFGMVMISKRCLQRVAELVGVVFDAKGKVIDGELESLYTSECNWWERPGAKDDIVRFITGLREAESTDTLGLDFVDFVDRLHWKAKSFGEDWSFCKKARRAGCEVWVDPSFELGHYGDYSYGIRDFLAQQELARLETEAIRQQVIEAGR